MKLSTPQRQDQSVAVTYSWGQGGYIYRRTLDSSRKEQWHRVAIDEKMAERFGEPSDARILSDDEWEACKAP